MKIIANGKAIEAGAAQGESLLSLLMAEGYWLNAPCGGGGRCGKCRVTIERAPPPTATEARLIPAEDLSAGVRLACATSCADGMVVHFEKAGARAASIATESLPAQAPFEPQVKLKTIALPPPGLDDQRADLDRLASALGVDNLTAPPDVLAELPNALRRSGWKAAVALRGEKMVALNPSGIYGVALDIGTTTLAAYLLDLSTGVELAVASALNPQKAWGDDVITRAGAARSGGMTVLRDAVRQEINGLIGQLCQTAKVSPDDIFHVTVAGNTVMMHLFAGVTPEHIAESPFTPAFTSALELSAVEAGLRLNRHGMVSLLPCVSGYVGADTVAGMLAMGMDEHAEPTLLIDIGTNGEIALAAGGKLYACSTAAGPAFEGAHISHGMGGVAGAINTAAMDGGIRFTTIAGAPPQGICGSGLLDLVAGLLDAGVIDNTGRFDRDNAPPWVIFDGEGILVDKQSGIRLTGRDIREVQLAKAAVAAGIAVLLAEAGITEGDIRQVWLAGGFGSYLDIQSAGRVGLIPAGLAGRTAAIGNSSGAGAKAALLSAGAMAEAGRLARVVKYVELSARKDFQDAFVENMFF